MNFEQHEDLLLLAWTFEGSLLSSKAEAEVKAIEEFVQLSYEQAQRGEIRAVIWIQKVNCSDLHQDWLDELNGELLRDELRWRLARLYRLRKAIQEAQIPWFYLTEKSCLGTMAELMFACHRRFVFDRETWFGFPEMSIGQLPSLGWLAPQMRRKPKLLEAWQRQNLWKAEEAVQFGLVDAALSWKDWKVVLVPWVQRQIEAWEAETSQRPLRSPPLLDLQQLWVNRSIPLIAANHIQAYASGSSRLRESQAGIDWELVDSAAHFMCQPPYLAWLLHGLQQAQRQPMRLAFELVYLDISESVVPISIVSRLLDADYRLCFVADRAESLRRNLELTLSQIETRYRRQALLMFDKQLSWYVGKLPRQPLYPTLSFGSFRDVRFQHREIEIHGWALAAQSMERQVIEISEDQEKIAKHLSPYFQAIYCVKSSSAAVPLLYLTRSLALQNLLFCCEAMGEGLLGLLDQLRSLDWALLGSERHWQRFLEYRLSLQSLSHLSIPEKLGKFELDQRLLKQNNWKKIIDGSQPKKVPTFKKGPGWLHNYLSNFAYNLSLDLVKSGWIRSRVEADLYVADSMGYPAAWGSPHLFAERMGQRHSLDGELAQTWSGL